MTVPEPLAAALKTMATVAEQIREVEELLLKAAADVNQEPPRASEDLGLAIHEILDPLNYLELNQENPPARETGDEVSPTGHSAPSSPGAVHSKEPWEPCIDEVFSENKSVLVASFGRDGGGGELLRSNLERACACVNAMADVSDPEKLMTTVLNAVTRYKGCETEREVHNLLDAIAREMPNATRQQ